MASLQKERFFTKQESYEKEQSDWSWSYTLLYSS